MRHLHHSPRPAPAARFEPRPASRASSKSRPLGTLPVALLAMWLISCGAVAWGQTPDPDSLPAPPGLEMDAELRDGMRNAYQKFRREKTGLVAYLGGSITHNPGWTQMVDAELRRRFPDTQFTFVRAGIPSIDSTGHAFRLERDVLQKGLPDLLFVEAAVNDLHNFRAAAEQLRGLEGVVRRARRANRFLDIVLLHFADPKHLGDYAAGKTPEIIASHERVAERYRLPSVNLARETHRRIAAGQIDWGRDFKDVHPSPFGQRLYFLGVRRLFEQAWPTALDAEPPPAPVERELGKPLDPNAYDAGQLVTPARATKLSGFEFVSRWRPADQAGTRAGWVDVPMLVGSGPGATLTLNFEGRAIGLFLAAGPDSGEFEYRIDGGPWKRRDPFTPWSGGLHLPWALMLETELTSESHLLELRLLDSKHAQSRGHALRIRDFLVNGPALDLPPLLDLTVRSSLDGSDQPSRWWSPESANSEPRPLLVYLHSWSSDYRQDNSPWQREAVARGWIYLHPNFRGVNRTPAACGSPLARQDVLDAIDEVSRRVRVDRRRVYLAGTSGGGHMALLLAAYHPERFSAASAWVGISDLAEWYRFHAPEGKRDHYAQMTVDALGGAPGSSDAVDAEYRARSPLFHLARAKDVPLDMAAGVTDGQTGSVPIAHSLQAFNVVASATGGEPVTDEEARQLVAAGRLAAPRPSDQESDATMGRAIFLRRAAGPSRVTIFDGGHEGLPRPACEWLARQQRNVELPATSRSAK